MIRICLCPTSINWIRRHLKKSAKAAFNAMLKRNNPPKTKKKRTKGKKSTRKGNKSQQNRMKQAARKCKGKKGKAFKDCMKKALRKPR